MRSNEQHKIDVKREELIITHRPNAIKMAQSILKKWEVALHKDDIQSAADTALCEAAARYKPNHGAQFTTYLFYFVKGALYHEISFQKRGHSVQFASDVDHINHVDALDMHVAEQVSHEEVDTLTCYQTPEVHSYQAELRVIIDRILESLSEVESTTLVNSFIYEDTMQSIAKDMNYSRSYIFSIRNNAVRKVKAACMEYGLSC